VPGLTLKAKNRMSGHGTLPSRADDVCWQLKHYHHHHVIQKAAYSQNATKQPDSRAMLEGSTIWWFAAFLFLLGFSTLDIIVKSTSGPATPPVPTNRAVSEQSERRKGLPMPKVEYISSQNEIPAGQKYVLVMYGEEYAETRHPLGLTITVASTAGELSFLTAVHTAKDIAKHAGISEVFVCTSMIRGPNPTPSGMFTYVPAHDELSSNVVGLDVYNKDKQNIGTIKDIALDANGLNGYIVSVGKLLGMGEHYVVVRPSAISFNAKDNKWHATMSANADQLKAAPEYKYSSES
jgi:PRC-barrel domain